MKNLKEKYVLSDQGAKDLCKGILYSVLAYISLMLPVALLAMVLDAFLKPILNGGSAEASMAFYMIVGIVILAVIFSCIISSTPSLTWEPMKKVNGAGLRWQKSYVLCQFAFSRNMIYLI